MKSRMPAPYTPTANVSEPLPHRRAVRRYFILTVLLLAIAVLMSIPGITLLNQEYGWFPTQSEISDIQINGYSVSNSSVIQYSIGLALVLLMTAILFCGIAIRNWNTNKTTLLNEEDSPEFAA